MDPSVEDHFWDASHMDHGDLAWLGGPKGGRLTPLWGSHRLNCPHLSYLAEKYLKVQMELVIDKICSCHVILPLIQGC